MTRPCRLRPKTALPSESSAVSNPITLDRIWVNCWEWSFDLGRTHYSYDMNFLRQGLLPLALAACRWLQRNSSCDTERNGTERKSTRLLCPEVHHLTGKLRPVVTEQHLRHASLRPDLVLCADHIFASTS